MINANELRIGNYVDVNQYPLEDTYLPMVVSSISYNETYDKVVLEHVFDSGGWQGGVLDWKPIPLTEEILLKCGFRSNPYQDRYELGSLHIECDKTKGQTALWINDFPYVKHLHQLQNLYFALTNQEIEIAS